MKITGADHTNWQVRYLERSLGFYRDVLGLEPLGLRSSTAVVEAPVTPTLKSSRLSRTKVASS
jgi:catechol-2,3-dioxygenase